MERAGADFAREAHITDYRSYFEDFLEYAANMLEGKKKVCVLKSADKSDSIRLYVPFYQALGAKVTVLEAEEIEENLGCLANSSGGQRAESDGYPETVQRGDTKDDCRAVSQ